MCDRDCLNCKYPDCIADNSLLPIEAFEIKKAETKVCKTSDKKRRQLQEYYKKNKEAIRASQAAYRAEHKGEAKQKRAAYYQAHKSECIGCSQKWQKENSDKVAQYEKSRAERKKITNKIYRERKKAEQAELLRQMQQGV